MPAQGGVVVVECLTVDVRDGESLEDNLLHESIVINTVFGLGRLAEEVVVSPGARICRLYLAEWSVEALPSFASAVALLVVQRTEGEGRSCLRAEACVSHERHERLGARLDLE